MRAYRFQKERKSLHISRITSRASRACFSFPSQPIPVMIPGSTRETQFTAFLMHARAWRLAALTVVLGEE
ncbi:hypothetical protein B0H19DRAFT_425454 [Mycena capillaripes]|nr:hypothetical protein B0H19DRAFT_425454 [Mycena capillaripes]